METDAPHGADAPQAPKPRLWTRDFTLVTFATTLGAAGEIAGEFALSFFVFDETGSTLAAALVLAVRLFPGVFVPLVVSPIMDRLPRKAFLVAGDVVCGVSYALLGLWLRLFEFSYISYLLISLVLASLQSVDNLAWTSIYPSVIPEGAEQRGFAISSMLFTILSMVMAPVAAILLDTIGVANILLMQGGLAVAAAAIESLIHVADKPRDDLGEGPYGLVEWAADLRETTGYLSDEGGLRGLIEYMAVSNGLAAGWEPILIAFFRTTPGFNVAMYSLFSLAMSAGYSLGSAVQYRVDVPREKRFPLAFFVYQVFDLMDSCLLWLPYPLMLANRSICGFLGANSYIMRNAAMQRFIPERMRSRVNAFADVLVTAVGAAMSVVIGLLGEVLDYRVCVTLCGLACLVASWLLVWRRRRQVNEVFLAS
ncbi:MAG: MFS transporter [Atopobiaceae bacterium]|nr:MFS transporter [Atopobiaceae bacterium]